MSDLPISAKDPLRKAYAAGRRSGLAISAMAVAVLAFISMLGIDGELDAARIIEIRAAMEADPVLQAEYARLAALDRSWRDAAAGAEFPLAISTFPDDAQPERARYLAIAAVIVAVLVRIAGKFPMTMSESLTIHAAALAVLICATMRMVVRADPQIRNQ
jgi:anti-sigma factor RsiW